MWVLSSSWRRLSQTDHVLPVHCEDQDGKEVREAWLSWLLLWRRMCSSRGWQSGRIFDSCLPPVHIEERADSGVRTLHITVLPPSDKVTIISISVRILPWDYSVA